MKLKKNLFIFLLSLSLFNLQKIVAQTPDWVWAKGFGGSGYDFGHAIALDSTGNIFAIGDFKSTVDFDPGVGNFDLTSIGIQDVFISKYDNAGNFLWAKQVGGSGSGLNGFAIALDAFGNIYYSGRFSGTVDFDPGAGIYNLSSLGMGDIFIGKLDAAGNFLWAKQLSGSDDECAYSVAIDNSNNVVLTGYFNGSVDFDLGSGVMNLTAQASMQCTLPK